MRANQNRLILAALLIVALLCIDLCTASLVTTLELKPIPPKHVYDKVKRHDKIEGPLPDSRVYQSHRKRDSIPIGGGIGTLGTYYAEILVAGHPFRVVVDTGSSVLYIPGTDCVMQGGPNSGDRCFTFNTPLSPSNSNLTALSCQSMGCSCNSDTQCALSTTFGDGSSVQAAGYDTTVKIGSLTSSNASFGLITKSSTGFVNDEGTQMDGLWGLGYQVYPNNALVVIKPVLESIFEDNPSVDQIFAVDLELEGGTLTIGSVDSTMVSNSTLHWTRVIAHGWYVINNPQFAVGTSPDTLGAGNGGQTTDADTSGISTIVDTGATLIVLPSTYWTALRDAMQQVAGCGVKYMCGSSSIWERGSTGQVPLCYTNFPLSDWPTIAVLLPSIGEVDGPAATPATFLNSTLPTPSSETTMKLVLNPSQYMVRSTDTQGRSCLAFGFSFSDSDFLIFGDTLLTQFYTIFDRENDRVGFVPKSPPGMPIAPQSPLAPSGSLGPSSSASMLSLQGLTLHLLLIGSLLLII